MIKIGVKVMPRQEVLDTQGRAVENILRQNGQAIESCRVGRYVILEFENIDQGEAVERATAMAESVLHNSLIETFELETL